MLFPNTKKTFSKCEPNLKRISIEFDSQSTDIRLTFRPQLIERRPNATGIRLGGSILNRIDLHSRISIDVQRDSTSWVGM